MARPLACAMAQRSEEHTSELQSLRHLVCRLLLEKKKKKHKITDTYASRLSRLITLSMVAQRTHTTELSSVTSFSVFFAFFFFCFFFFFFNDTATTEIYTLSLHDALPI